MTQNEKLLINTLDELQEKLNKGDEYNLIRASGLIRQLLIDENPLVISVNRLYKIPILFRTNKQSKQTCEDFIENGISWKVIIGISFINPIKEDEKNIEYIKLNKFLNYNIIYFSKQQFTVIQIIKICAHIYGGVHAGVIKDKKDFILDQANKTISCEAGMNYGVSAMKEIIKITLDALKPLVEEIKIKYNIKNK